jgi:hypothetical protein
MIWIDGRSVGAAMPDDLSEEVRVGDSGEYVQKIAESGCGLIR